MPKHSCHFRECHFKASTRRAPSWHKWLPSRAGCTLPWSSDKGSLLRIVWIGWLANVQKDSLSPGRARAPTLGGAEKMLCSSMPSSTLKTEHGKRKLF